MPEDQSDTAEATPFTVDRELLAQLKRALEESHRTAIEDSNIAHDKATEINRQVSSFYERLLLLNVGTIGISLSALISFSSKMLLAGWHKPLVVVVVSLGWICLLLSARLCGLIMLISLASNKLMFEGWLRQNLDYNSATLSQTIAALSSSMKGTVIVNGKPYDPEAVFGAYSKAIKAEYDKVKSKHEGKSMTEVVAAMKFPPEEQSAAAIRLMQRGMALLAIAAVVLLTWI